MNLFKWNLYPPKVGIIRAIGIWFSDRPIWPNLLTQVLWTLAKLFPYLENGDNDPYLLPLFGRVNTLSMKIFVQYLECAHLNYIDIKWIIIIIIFLSTLLSLLPSGYEADYCLTPHLPWGEGIHVMLSSSSPIVILLLLHFLEKSFTYVRVTF